MKKIILILVLIFITGCASGSKPIISILTDTQEIPIEVDVADSLEERRQGLMGVEYLPENTGMIFVFKDEGNRGFWMKNTLIPLDLIFIAANGSITDIKKDFQPCIDDPCETYSSKAKYVLEVNAGFTDEHDILIGDVVRL